MPERFSLKSYPNAETAQTYAAREISAILQKYSEAKTPVLFLVSGGSALKLIDAIDSNAFNPNLTIGVLDERFSADPAVNNFSQLSQTSFYAKAKAAGCTFVDTRVQNNETIESLTWRFTQALKDWKENHHRGGIIITQGIGSDGHTAGILPFPEDEPGFEKLFNQPDVWVVHYDAAGKNPYPWRVTTTLSFLRLVDHAIVFICGQDKQVALLKTVAETGSLAQTPARIIREMNDVAIYTDIQI